MSTLMICDRSIGDGDAPFQADVGAGRADEDLIGAVFHGPFHIGINNAQVTIIKVKRHLAGLARLECNSLKGLQLAFGLNDRWMVLMQIELNDFVALAVAGIGHLE